MPRRLTPGEAAGRLERLVQDLEERARRLSSAPGHIAVLATHVLLHYRPPDEVPWAELLGHSEVPAKNCGKWRHAR